MGWYILLAIAAFIILTLIDHILAKEFYFVAQQKGYTDRKYYWYCFCFTIIGYLLVIALPYKKGNTNIGTRKKKGKFLDFNNAELPEDSSKWICRSCGAFNSEGDTVCYNCTAPKNQ